LGVERGRKRRERGNRGRGRTEIQGERKKSDVEGTEGIEGGWRDRKEAR